MRLLITGGAGFIGSNFIRYWFKKHPNDQIVNLDKLTYAGHIESTFDFQDNPNYKFVQKDICDKEAVDSITQGIDTIVHFAAESHVDRSIDNPSTFVKTNVLGTQVLLDAALKNNIKRFHHVSTDEVFGALKADDKKFDEDTPYNPHSPYSASKAGSDHLVRAYHDTYGLPATITNCSNNFGPYQDPEKFIPRMITDIIEKREPKIYGDGLYVRDWLYVEDHCRAIDLVINSEKVGETYMVGGQTQEISNLEVARMLLRIFDKSEAELKFVKDRPGHDRRYSVNWEKINRELGWSPVNIFEDWLKKTVDWYKENESWWKPLKEESEKLYKKTGQV